MAEWLRGESAPTKFWLSTMPPDTPIEQLIRLAKLRWRIERDYEELKQEIGLGHYEGRKWRGFHHHASMCIAAYAFLVAERGLFSPRGVGDQSRFDTPGVSAVDDPAELPVRPERHNPTSIATLHKELTVALVRRLQRCPCCQRQNWIRCKTFDKLIE